MVRGAEEGCRSPDGGYVQRQGLEPLQGAGLRPLRPRRQASQRQLAVRRPRRRLGLGGDHARVRGRRLLDRPVRGARPRRPGRLPLLHLALGQLAQPAQPGQRPDRAALRRRGLRPRLRQPARRRLRRGQLDPVHLDGAPRSRRALRRDRRPRRRREPPRPLPAQAQRRPRRHARRPRAARQRAQPERALALRLGGAAPQDPGGGAASAPPLRRLPGRLPRQRRPRHALLLVRVRGARPLPGGPRRRRAGDRQPALPRGRRCAWPAGGSCGSSPPPTGAPAAAGGRRRSPASFRSPLPGLPTSRPCASTATPTEDPGRRSARWPAGRPSPTGSGRGRTAPGATPPPRCRRPSGTRRPMPENHCAP